MNRLERFTLAIIVFFVSLTAYCQDGGVSVGNWRTHLPYQKVIDVEVFGKKVFAATTYELFYYDTEDNSVHILNKINGLSDIGISTIRYNKAENLLFVAYTNTNIDLVDANGDVTNMSDIKDKNIMGNKVINNVFFNGSDAYVACGFGIVVFDLARKEVKDTYYIGDEGAAVNVTDIAFYDGRIYASSDEGVYYASLDSPNLANYAVWQSDQSLIHPDFAYNEMEAFAGRLFLNYSGGFNKDTVFVYDGHSWDYFGGSTNSLCFELRAYDDCLVETQNYSVSIYDATLTQTTLIYNPAGSITPLSTAIGSNGTYWIGDTYRGLIMSDNGWHGENISPNGPYSNSVFELSSCGDNVWISTGGHDSNWGKKWMKLGVSHFDGSWWTNLNRNNVAAFDTITDFICAATNPSDESVTYVGTWGSGLLKIQDNQVKEVYSKHNSTLGVWTADTNYVNVSGVAFDSNKNLWVANSGANKQLSVMKPDGTWRAFNLGASFSGTDLSVMIVDGNDYKWILMRRGGDASILVFNDNGTLDDTSDDRVVALKAVTGLGGLSGTANCMAVDRDGAVWVGTSSGPCVFTDTKKLFNSTSYDASRIMIPRNDGTGQSDPLFDGVNVLSIAVGGDNNKWFGLETGVYEMSDDCLTQKNCFTTDNSPLLDNSVNTMAINASGEVFFGTDEGVISYRGRATEPNPTNTDVVAYPNPVRPGYSGYVAIKGLVTDALVRITTADAGFVTQLRAEGGQAVWDCCTIDGRKVSPGIYLVFISTDSGTDKYVTKILVMN